jgi:hypothetical protein
MAPFGTVAETVKAVGGTGSWHVGLVVVVLGMTVYVVWQPPETPLVSNLYRHVKNGRFHTKEFHSPCKSGTAYLGGMAYPSPVNKANTF